MDTVYCLSVCLFNVTNKRQNGLADWAQFFLSLMSPWIYVNFKLFLNSLMLNEKLEN